MSYSLFGHFVDTHNHKVLAASELAFLKNLNEYRYSKDMGGINPTGKAKDEDYKEVSTYLSREFYNYFQEELLLDEALKDHIEPYNNKRHSYGIEYPRYIADLDWIKEHEDEIDKYKVPYDQLKEDKESGGRIMLFSRTTKNNDGSWYTRDDFSRAYKDIVGELEKKKTRSQKLHDMRDSRDWFEMSEDAKNSLLDEIGYVDEDLEDICYKKEALDRILSYFDFWADDWYYKDEQDNYVSAYDDKREIELYLEVD